MAEKKKCSNCAKEKKCNYVLGECIGWNGIPKKWEPKKRNEKHTE
jgi:hypothetical protein